MRTIVSTEPKRNLTAVYEDALYTLVVRDYGRHTDQGGNTEPALFVYSKEKDKWLQVTEISTVDGVFGKSSLPRGVIKRLLTGSRPSWDHTELAKQEYAKIPLQVELSLGFPTTVLWEKGKKRYKLSFLPLKGDGSTGTTLYIKAEDLKREFTKAQ